MDFNPNRVVLRFHCRAATPLGLVAFGDVSQGSSFLATLGFEPESRWDSARAFSKVLKTRPSYASSSNGGGWALESSPSEYTRSF